MDEREIGVRVLCALVSNPSFVTSETLAADDNDQLLRLIATAKGMAKAYNNFDSIIKARAEAEA